MCAVLAVCHFVVNAVYGNVVSNLKHIGVVPVAGACVLAQWLVLVDDVYDALRPPVRSSLCIVSDWYGKESRADVSGCTPGVAYVSSPFPRLVGSPFAHTEKDGAAGLCKGVAHKDVRALGVCVLGGAPVIFEVVYSPGCVCEGVLILVSAASGISGAGEVSGIAVNAKFHSLAMDIVRKGFDSGREFYGVAGDESKFIPVSVPSVVKVQVNIACIYKAQFNHSVSRGLDEVLVDLGHKAVPGVPTHLGGVGKAFEFGKVRSAALGVCHSRRQCNEDCRNKDCQFFHIGIIRIKNLVLLIYFQYYE